MYSYQKNAFINKLYECVEFFINPIFLKHSFGTKKNIVLFLVSKNN